MLFLHNSYASHLEQTKQAFIKHLQNSFTNSEQFLKIQKTKKVHRYHSTIQRLDSEISWQKILQRNHQSASSTKLDTVDIEKHVPKLIIIHCAMKKCAETLTALTDTLRHVYIFHRTNSAD